MVDKKLSEFTSIEKANVLDFAVLYKESGNMRNGKLAMSKLDQYYDSIYLTKSSASSNYLNKTDASNTYLSKISAAESYISKTDCANTYLSKVDASNNYLNKTDASNTYLTQSDAADTYISKTERIFNLFDYKWSDYTLNDIRWLDSTTFSWQSGAVYKSAYQHLASDYNTGTSQTETVGSYTITYKLATDGHKITTDETNVANIYAECGVAWYYVIDTTNQQFKLPRINPTREELIQTIRAKGNGNTIGYQITADGETRGVAEFGSYRMATTTTIGAVGDSASVSTMNQNKFIGLTRDSTKSGIISDITDSTSVYKGNKHLYFFIGEFTQTAIEETAGLNAELFNTKADVDLSNINPSQAIKETIISWVMPDWSAGTDIDIPLQATPYTCPTDGVYVANFMHDGGNNKATYLYVNGIKTANCLSNSDANNRNKASISVYLKRGDVIYFDYGCTNTSNIYSTTFYPLTVI